MNRTDLLILLLTFSALLIIAYRFYYHVYYKNKVNFSRPLSTSKKILHISSWLLTIGFLSIAAYLFIAPAGASSHNSNIEWKDLSKPLEITFDKPVSHSLTKLKFSKELKGEWAFEEANKYDIFKRKLVFYPEESLLPNDEITLEANITTFLGISSSKITSKITTIKETPEISVNEELDDKQNVNPSQELRINMNKANPLTYIVNLESEPSGLFESNTHFRLTNEELKIPHFDFTNGTAYEVRIYASPISYSLKTGQIIKTGNRSLLKLLKFNTANSPKIKEILPSGNNVLSNEKIQVAFDTEMDRESVEKGFKTEPALSGAFVWNEDATKVVFEPQALLQKEVKYKVQIAPTIKSKFGALFSQSKTVDNLGINHEFKTIGSVGIASTIPASGSVNLEPSNISISIRFNQSVDKTSAESKISFIPALSGKFYWENSTVNFKPDSTLKSAMKYTVNISAGIKSLDGLDLKNGYSFNFTTKSKTVLLKAPIINQPAQFACNATAAAIVLQYKGINVSPWDVYNGIPKQTAPKTQGTWGNPNIGYVGNVYGTWGGDKTEGYGVHWDPIRNYISKYRPAEVKRGWNTTELLQEIDNGNLSILWWQNGAASPNKLSWKAPDGSTIQTVNGMHSEVVVGYVGSPENPTQIILSDPWASRWGNKYRYISITQFRSLWSYFGNTAVLVK